MIVTVKGATEVCTDSLKGCCKLKLCGGVKASTLHKYSSAQGMMRVELSLSDDEVQRRQPLSKEQGKQKPAPESQYKSID